MKKNFISFRATFATELAQFMDDREALSFIYADYSYWCSIIGKDVENAEFDINQSILAWNVHCATSLEYVF